MDDDKAIRSAKLTLGGMLEKKRAKSAVERAQGQIAPSKYLPNVPRQVHADGGSAGMGDNGGPPLSEPPVDLGQVREQKQLQTFHKGVMGDIGTRMTQAMEAHQKAVDAGHFDGYEVGDVLQGRGSPLKITGRYVQQWKPNRMTLEHFDRLGAKPSIIEHEGKQYVPMLRYTSGSEEGGDNQEGSLYLDAVKATGMRKMGGLRAVKANGGAIHLIHGGADFDEIDPRFSGTGEPGNIRPLGKGLYTFVLDPNDPDSAKEAIGWAKRYATKYGRGKKTLHVFQVPTSASTVFNGPRSIEGMGVEPQDKLAAYRAHRDAEPAKDDPSWWDWSRKSNALYEDVKNAADLRMERLPIGLTEAAINNPKVAQRVGKFDPEADPDEIIKAIRGYASGGYVPAAVLPVPKLAVAKPLLYGSARPSGLEALAGIAGSASKLGETASGVFGKGKPDEQPPAQDSHAGRAEAGGGMSPQAVAAYNALLEAYGQPLTVTSTYRDPAENQRVKGAKNSQHMHGNAYDIDTSGMSYEDRLALADMAWNAGFRGVGFYDNSMHFDVGDPRSWGPTYSRDSIPDWAQDWTQQRYGYANGGRAQGKERFLAGNHPLVPEVLYHGTARDIRSFHPDAKRSYDVDPLNPDETDTGWFGKGHYLTAIPQMADHYAEEGAKRHGGEGANVIPVHVSMKNPFVVDMKAYDSGATTLDQALTRAGVPLHPRGWRKPSEQTAALMQMGHDGVIATREGKPKEYVAFKPEQIKSAISATKFDPNNPDMTYANGGAAPTMSPLLIEEEMKRDAMKHPDAAAQTNQALDAISNAGRVGSIAGKLTGIPLGGVMGRKLAESIAMSEYGYADGGRVDEDVDGIDAYHGSPHDFDEFDIGKLGTGEGAQAYGHGLYFAGNERVARGYRDDLAAKSNPRLVVGENEFPVRRSGIDSGSREDVLHRLWKDRMTFHSDNPGYAWDTGLTDDALDNVLGNIKPSAEVRDWANSTIRGKNLGLPTVGHMYKVKLNVKPHELLDWDTPLAQQAAWQKVRQHWDKTKGDPDIIAERLGLDDKSTGRHLHDALVGNDGRTGQMRAANALSEAGIKGIRYRDAGSRNVDDGDPTHNYVMFHHDPVKVVDKYALGGYVPQKTVKAYKLFRTRGDGNLYPLFVHADKPVEMGKWLEAEEGPQGKAQGKVKSKLGDLAYRPGWHAGDLPIATHIGGKSSPDLKKPDYRPDNHVWAEVEMAADKDWQAEADSRGKGVKAHITDQVPLKGFYRYKTNPNMTGNWLIGGHMKVNRVLSDDEVKAINDQAGVADLPRIAKADGGSIVERSPMFEGMHEELYDEDGKPTELWHGTPHQFDAFDDSKIGSERDYGWYGRGHYLTPSIEAAGDYASEDPDEGHVMGPLHAALKNPYMWDVSDENRAHRTLRDLQSMGIMRHVNKLEPWSNLASHEIDTFMKHMQDRGHDGVLMKTQKERGRAGISEVVVFKPSAIKHRDAEVGDPEDPRIMRNLGGRLYSKASKIISRLKDEPMQVEDIIKYALENGAKRSEIDYSDPPRGGMARPSQVAQHIADMQPQVGVQRREGGNFRFKNSDEYLRELDRLNNRGMHDEAERLYDEFERFEGYGGANQPRYARYQLPGGENYREHILTLDNHQGQTYTAPIHWSGTQNPLAHIRMSDRIIGNRKILHIEELQSDWNNEARKRGFSTGTEQQDYDNFVSQMRQKAIDKVNARTGQDYYDPMTGETAPTMSPMVAQAQIEKYQRMDPYMLAMKMGMQEEHRQLAQAAKGGNGVPRAPYINPDRDDVTELAMKHILTEAAKGGYDGIAFTPDAAQSERWKGTNFKNMYDRKFPGMAQRLIRQHDLRGGSDDDPQIIDGWAAPHVELTEKARQGILQNGFSSFRRGGYVTHVRRAR